jgi:hypothetical protein
VALELLLQILFALVIFLLRVLIFLPGAGFGP